MRFSAGIPELLRNLEADTTNVLLTLARIRFTTETGTLLDARDRYLRGETHLPVAVDEHVRSAVSSLVATVERRR